MPRLLMHVLAMLVVGAIWALTPALAKLAMQQGMRPLGVAAVTAAVAGVVLLAVGAARGQRSPLDRAHLLQYAGGGVTGLVLANLFAFTGLQRAPAGLFALMVPLSGLLTVVFFALARVERAGRWRWIGALVGMCGVALAMAPGAALPDATILPWAAVMLLTPVCYAIANLLSVKLATRGTPPLAQAAGTVVCAAGAAALLAWPLGHLGLPPTGLVAALLLMQGVLTGLAYLLYFHLLVQAGGVFTSQVAYVITLAGLGWGFALFGEVPGPLTIPAALLIFGGLALVSFAPKPPPITRRSASSRSRRS
jgi:drug/metabolite transporter (DMT)-like permease